MLQKKSHDTLATWIRVHRQVVIARGPLCIHSEAMIAFKVDADGSVAFTVLAKGKWREVVNDKYNDISSPHYKRLLSYVMYTSRDHRLICTYTMLVHNTTDLAPLA